MPTLVLVVGVVVVATVAIFALVRMDRESRETLYRYCENCGDDLTQKNFCSHCGEKSVLKPRCECGRYFNPFREGGNYCSSCGKPLPTSTGRGEKDPEERPRVSGR